MTSSITNEHEKQRRALARKMMSPEITVGDIADLLADYAREQRREGRKAGLASASAEIDRLRAELHAADARVQAAADEVADYVMRRERRKAKAADATT